VIHSRTGDLTLLKGERKKILIEFANKIFSDTIKQPVHCIRVNLIKAERTGGR
jgi:hypothetical protein